VSFQSLNLDARLLSAVEKLRYTSPTEIQLQAIPFVLEGRDLMASAQTGTGKTAAFMLPAMHRLLTVEAKKGRGPRVLVLAPTRELAQQVTDAVRDFGKGTSLRAGAVVGGVPYHQQERLLSAPLDVLVATPGRLMDLMNRGRVDFSRIELLVLDEADRMLDMGFVEDIETIVERIPNERQTLLFSATLEGDVIRVAKELLKNPERVHVGGAKTKHESISQQMLIADDQHHKTALLGSILEDNEVYQAVVFVATKRSADEMARAVKDMGHTASALHGDMRQSVRNRVLEKMHRGKLRVLIATDVAARGLDVKGLTHVINYDLPRVAEDYVHRIGRTGRAGSSGSALSLVGPQDWSSLSQIKRLTGQSISEIQIEGLEPRTKAPANPHKRNSGRKSFGSRRPGRQRKAPQGANGRVSSSSSSYRPSGDRFGNDRPARANSGSKQGPSSRGDSQQGNYRGGQQSNSKPFRADSRSNESRPFRTRSDRPSGGRTDRPARGRDERQTSDRSDRPFRTRSDRPFGSRTDRPARGRDDRQTGDRSDRPFRTRSDRPSGDRTDRPFRTRTDRSAGGRTDRPARGRDDRSTGDRTERPFRTGSDRPSRGGNARPARPGAGRGKPFGKPSAQGAKRGFKGNSSRGNSSANKRQGGKSNKAR